MQVVNKLWRTVFPTREGVPAPNDPLRAPGGTELSLIQTLTGHSERVWCVAWHPRGEVLASCGGDPFVCFYDSTGVCFLKLQSPHQRTVRRISWSPDGHYLATCSFDATVLLWAVSEDAHSFTQCGVLEGHDHEVKACAWDASGELIATCSRDKSVWVWDKPEPEEPGVETEHECMCVLNGHSQDVKYVTWHPSKEELYSCSYDDSIRMWVQSEARDGDWYCEETLHAHTSTVWQVALDPVNPCRMISCSDDESCILWHRGGAGWKRACTLTGSHTGGVIYSVDWSKTNVIVSGGADNAIVVYEENRLTDPSGLPVSFSSTVVVREAHKGDVNCVQWNPSSPSIVASCGDDGVVKIWRYQ